MNYQTLSLHFSFWSYKKIFCSFSHYHYASEDVCTEVLSAEKPNLRDLGWILDSSPILRLFCLHTQIAWHFKCHQNWLELSRKEKRNSDAITSGFFFSLDIIPSLSHISDNKKLLLAQNPKLACSFSLFKRWRIPSQLNPRVIQIKNLTLCCMQFHFQYPHA